MVASLPRVGDCVDQYEIVGELACGGMAAVYAVRRTGPAGVSRLQAMKLMLPHLRRDPERVKMFLDEARIAACIHHPSVVQVIDVGEIEGSPMLVMELVRGRSLQQVVQRAREREVPIPMDFSLAVLAFTAAGLHAAHETIGPDGRCLEIVHRDVNPKNILIGFQGEVKLVDFGIARARGRLRQTRTGELLATLHYVAPEQIDRTSALDRRTDIWALGVVAWELLTGRDLFPEGDEATTLWNVLHYPVPDLSEEAAVPGDIAAAVGACLRRSPDQRIRRCDQVERAMAEALRRQRQDPARAIALFMAQLYEVESTLGELEFIYQVATESISSAATGEGTTTVDRMVANTAPLTGVGAAVDLPDPRRWTPVVLLAVLAVVLSIAGLLWLLRPSATTATGAAVSAAASSGRDASVLDAISSGVGAAPPPAAAGGLDAGARPDLALRAERSSAPGGVVEKKKKKRRKAKRRGAGRRKSRPKAKREAQELMENPF